MSVSPKRFAFPPWTEDIPKGSGMSLIQRVAFPFLHQTITLSQNMTSRSCVIKMMLTIIFESMQTGASLVQHCQLVTVSPATIIIINYKYYYYSVKTSPPCLGGQLSITMNPADLSPICSDRALGPQFEHKQEILIELRRRLTKGMRRNKIF